MSFGGSDHNDPNTFINDISHYLLNCFLLTAQEYATPIDPTNPTKVVIKNIGVNKLGTVEVTDVERRWYPTLFSRQSCGKGSSTGGDRTRTSLVLR